MSNSTDKTHIHKPKYLHQHSLNVDSLSGVLLPDVHDLRNLQEEAGQDGDDANDIGQVMCHGLVHFGLHGIST